MALPSHEPLANSVTPMINRASASELLKPYDARLMRCYPVSTRVNSATK
jgi:hypothetical protein